MVPVFDNIMSQSLLKDNLFAFYLGSSALGEESDLTFGYYDKTKFIGKIQWNPVIFKYMYGMRLDDVLINGKSLKVCSPEKPCIVTVDSGSSLLAMPRFGYEQLIKRGLPTRTNKVDCKS
jgi:saccharopepsin